MDQEVYLGDQDGRKWRVQGLKRVTEVRRGPIELKDEVDTVEREVEEKHAQCKPHEATLHPVSGTFGEHHIRTVDQKGSHSKMF